MWVPIKNNSCAIKVLKRNLGEHFPFILQANIGLYRGLVILCTVSGAGAAYRGLPRLGTFPNSPPPYIHYFSRSRLLIWVCATFRIPSLVTETPQENGRSISSAHPDTQQIQSSMLLLDVSGTDISRGQRAERRRVISFGMRSAAQPKHYFHARCLALLPALCF